MNKYNHLNYILLLVCMFSRMTIGKIEILGVSISVSGKIIKARQSESLL